MQRLKDDFLQITLDGVGLQDKDVLEVGCGSGSRSVGIAASCKSLTAIEPDAGKVALAQARGIQNAVFQKGTAESLPFAPSRFDVVIFTLSFHHVPVALMPEAINEAVRVVKRDGHIVFLEPGLEGSFFEAELAFDACDGDERQAKEAAYHHLTTHLSLQLVEEIPDETIILWESLDEFTGVMTPRKSIADVASFLEAHNYILNAKRKILIFKPKK